MGQVSRGPIAVPSAVRIGGMTKSDLLQALRRSSVQLNQAAEGLFEDRRFTTLAHQELIEIAAVSISDLGLEGGATYPQVTARAFQFGLVECPLELGPHLRMQFSDQIERDDGIPSANNRAPPGSVTVASSPLDDSDETAKGFYLRRVDGVLWLRGYWSWPGHVWSSDDVLVFGRGGLTK